MAVNDLITFRKGTASEWTSANPVLASGEPGYDLTNSILKIGDGVSNWVALSGIGSTSLNNSSSSIGVRGIISTTGILSSFAVSGGYPVGYLDLFQDGVKLVSSLDFSATDGSSVTLSNSVPSGTVLEYLTISSGVSSGGGSGLTWSSVPASPTASGTAGNIAYDGSYIYVCQATNAWGRAPVAWDNNFSSVTSLLQFDLAFPVDSAGNSWTISGSPTMSRTGGKFGGAIVFPNSPASYITTSRTNELEIGDSDFTLEWWLRPTAYPAGSNPQYNSLLYSTRGTAAVAGFIAVMNPAGKLATFISSNSSSWDISAGTLFTTSVIPLNQWTHIALTRSGTTYRGFFNGALEVTTTLSGTPSTGTGGMFIAGDTGGERFVGSMDDFRFTKMCRYTTTFTPPIAAFANR